LIHEATDEPQSGVGAFIFFQTGMRIPNMTIELETLEDHLSTSKPTRSKDTKHLQPFWEYRNLNRSSEPLQSNWMQSER
jgi:hypothetical protein